MRKKVVSYINSDRKYRKAKSPKNLKCLDQFSLKEFLELDLEQLKSEIEFDRDNYYISFRLTILNENYYSLDRIHFIELLQKLKTLLLKIVDNTTMQLILINQNSNNTETKFMNEILKAMIKEIEFEINIEIFAKYHGWKNLQQ
ncbi:MAG TPA: hypothetical protein PLH46_03915 [Caldisericia bacterium]|mgnify:FL=1|nr:hypothetical protein [Methanofastidiosum sp.]HQJ56772.1 hypothetical protein [Caldisericia bacterium]